ncbi:MAG TPA: cytochrome c [Solirubrobacterales bacterium]|nr:cytochrome c [Solirubrobacterales bacterium]
MRLLLVALLMAGAVASAAMETHAAPEQESEGRRLFVQGCSSCHGFDAGGVEGKGPSLIGAGAGAADFYLRTGRMPLDRPDQEPVRSDSPYSEEQIEALVAYVGGLGGPSIPAVHPEEGDLAEGQRLFTDHCAGCHQVVAQGGMVPDAVVPDLGASSALDVAEAVHVGPYVMPKFDHLDQSEIDDIARYVEYTHDPEDRGGWGLGHIGPIPEGMVAWLLAGAALLLAIRLIGERKTR